MENIEVIERRMKMIGMVDIGSASKKTKFLFCDKVMVLASLNLNFVIGQTHFLF